MLGRAKYTGRHRVKGERLKSVSWQLEELSREGSESLPSLSETGAVNHYFDSEAKP